jgi:hypothetical protein
MSKTLVHVTTQYYENYGYEIHGVSHAAWKPKGSFIFSLKIDLSNLMYAPSECIEVIRLLLADQSNEREKFEYLSHEIIFNDIIELDAEKFESLFNDYVNESLF